MSHSQITRNRNTTDPFEGIETYGRGEQSQSIADIETPLTRLRGLRREGFRLCIEAMYIIETPLTRLRGLRLEERVAVRTFLDFIETPLTRLRGLRQVSCKRHARSASLQDRNTTDPFEGIETRY